MKNKTKKSPDGNNCWIAIGVWSDIDNKCERLNEYVHCRNCPVFSTEGRRVLDKGVPTGYLPEWRKKISKKELSVDQYSESVLVFQVNNEWFGISAHCLDEITENRTIHRIPRNRNKKVEGIVNIGGEIQLCYSLANVLGVKKVPVEQRDTTVPGRFLVASLGDKNYVFRVDQVSGLSWYADKSLFQGPSTLADEGKGMLLGVMNENDNRVAILDVEKLQEHLEGVLL